MTPSRLFDIYLNYFFKNSGMVPAKNVVQQIAGTTMKHQLSIDTSDTPPWLQNLVAIRQGQEKGSFDATKLLLYGGDCSTCSRLPNGADIGAPIPSPAPLESIKQNTIPTIMSSQPCVLASTYWAAPRPLGDSASFRHLNTLCVPGSCLYMNLFEDQDSQTHVPPVNNCVALMQGC